MNAPSPSHQPLAERLRPKTLADVIGQQHLLGEGMPLRIAAELIETARKAPGKVDYGSGGNGSPQHIAMAPFDCVHDGPFCTALLRVFPVCHWRAPRVWLLKFFK